MTFAPPPPAAGAIVVGSFPMAGGRRFERHVHRRHQLVWAAEGVATVEVPGGTWVLPPSRALWVPSGVPHTTSAYGLVRSPYFRPESCRIDWTGPTAIGVPPLLRELIVYLADPGLPDPARARAEAVVLDLLEPVPVTTIHVPMPDDDRARRVAEALLADPADGRNPDAWGRAVGASGRTLSRLFVAETGMSFGHWRTQVRMRAALEHLAERVPVAVVAHRVGYATPSAFVAAFRRTFGVSPGAYFRTVPG
ncbi:MAG TPA: helix-turn-helix transcriptional regulator [Thermomonospora sp.]|nr:helix-turn-helix transcriptional regulator [Thermomonospora sp.]